MTAAQLALRTSWGIIFKLRIFTNHIAFLLKFLCIFFNVFSFVQLLISWHFITRNPFFNQIESALALAKAPAIDRPPLGRPLAVMQRTTGAVCPYRSTLPEHPQKSRAQPPAAKGQQNHLTGNSKTSKNTWQRAATIRQQTGNN